MSNSTWENYKEKLGDTRPWDILNPRTEYVSDEEAVTKLSICKECPRFISLTTQCKECGCVMKAKTKIKYAECPLKKW